MIVELFDTTTDPCDEERNYHDNLWGVVTTPHKLKIVSNLNGFDPVQSTADIFVIHLRCMTRAEKLEAALKTSKPVYTFATEGTIEGSISAHTLANRDKINELKDKYKFTFLQRNELINVLGALLNPNGTKLEDALKEIYAKLSSTPSIKDVSSFRDTILRL